MSCVFTCRLSFIVVGKSWKFQTSRVTPPHVAGWYRMAESEMRNRHRRESRIRMKQIRVMRKAICDGFSYMQLLPRSTEIVHYGICYAMHPKCVHVGIYIGDTTRNANVNRSHREAANRTYSVIVSMCLAKSQLVYLHQTADVPYSLQKLFAHMAFGRLTIEPNAHDVTNYYANRTGILDRYLHRLRSHTLQTRLKAIAASHGN